MKDFFISYNSADRTWAEWIAWQLEEAGYKVDIQAWDSQAGKNFIEWMDKASKNTRQTIAVLSPSYLKGKFSMAEWTAALYEEKLLPIQIQDFDVKGLFGPIVHIDLVGLKNEDAKKVLLDGIIKQERRKPEIEPEFPGTEKRSIADEPRFPGLIWNIPHSRNHNFTGREDLLNDLRSALTSESLTALTQIQVIHGLGGVGKTQLALEYAYRYDKEYDVVWWVRSEETTTLATDCASMAESLALPGRKESNQNIVIKSVLNWLGQNERWLLIFDNAEEPQLIRDYLPQKINGHVIITSRNPNWRGVACSFEMKEWERHESIDLILRSECQSDKDVANALADILGDLPLALEQAVAYIEETRISVTDYLDLFKSRHEELWEEESSPLDYPNTIVTTWNIAMDRIRKEAPVGTDILNLCAYLSPDGIPRSLFRETVDDLPETLSLKFNDTLAFNKGIRALRQHSLINVNHDELSVHRLVQAVTRDRIPEDKRKIWAETALLVINSSYPPYTRDVKFWPKTNLLLPHARSVIYHAEKLNVTIKETSYLMNKVGLYLRWRALYDEAESYSRKAIKIAKVQIEEDHPYVLQIMRNLANLLREQGKYNEAESLLDKVIKINRGKLGEDHLDVATLLFDFAILLQAQGKYKEAETFHYRALEIRKNNLEENHKDIAQSLHGLATLLHDQHKYDEAELFYRRALKIRKTTLEEKHISLGSILHNLARLLSEKGNYTEAEPLYRQSLDIYEYQRGKDHPELVSFLINLALLLQFQRRYAEAEPLFRRALEICEAQLGKDHPNTAMVRNNLEQLLEAIKTSNEK